MQIVPSKNFRLFGAMVKKEIELYKKESGYILPLRPEEEG
jgi:hypothetical protein